MDMTTTTQTGYHLSADQMATLIAEHGVARMAEVTNDAAKMLVAALGNDGIPAPLGWRTQQANGAVLFVQVERDADGHTVVTDGERILCVNAPESERARYAAMAADSDAPVRVLMLPATRDAERGERGSKRGRD